MSAESPESAAVGSTTAASGCVYLVGAGPGAVGLLTVRAVQIIATCDELLYDRLVPEEALKLVKPDAKLRYVGKDANVSTGKMKEQQDDISLQMVELAKEGKSVCRLKGGDPMIFGRAGEEMLELAKAGVPYEVVPGVTAVLSAGANACIPLTYRHASTSVRIYTMNPSTIKDPEFNWAQFNAPNATFALYMGLAVLPEVCRQLMAVGVDGAMPMALIDRASTADCQVVTGTVATLPEKVQGRSDLPGPALTLLGKVVEIREQLTSTKPKPTSEENSTTFAAAMAALPTLSDENLRRIREHADALLASRSSSVQS